MSKGTVLVTGGAGYIGSFILRGLAEAGFEAVALDDLSAGHRDAVEGFRLVTGDYAREDLIDTLLSPGEVVGVIHMASLCSVPESVARPDLYYEHLSKSLKLLEAARRNGVDCFVFSSSAAVYGEPRTVPITEDHPVGPINPYGEIKRAFEEALASHRTAHGLRATCLRYFNAAGAAPDGSLGEDHDPEHHLIPLALAAASGRRPSLSIFGTDYPTRDGTCVRDFIHVQDLARAHVLALEALLSGERGAVYNLGSERGSSVREVVETAGEVTGMEIQVLEEGRRPGDPATLVASCARAREALGWKAARGDLRTIIQDAWQWHGSHPEGYSG
jgi:UDP-glucose-4-epimerase GalE